MWAVLQPAVEAAKHSQAGAPGKMSDRDFLEALLYLNRTGCPWRDLPPELGRWIAVYMRFRRWEARGIWQRLWTSLQTEKLRSSSAVIHGFNHRACSSPRGRRTKKTASTRLWAALVEG